MATLPLPSCFQIFGYPAVLSCFIFGLLEQVFRFFCQRFDVVFNKFMWAHRRLWVFFNLKLIKQFVFLNDFDNIFAIFAKGSLSVRSTD